MPCSAPPCCWPGDQQRVDHPAAVVDRHVAHRPAPARSRCRPRRSRRGCRTGTSRAPARSRSSPPAARPARRPRGRASAQPTAGVGHAAHREPVVAELDVVDRRLEQLGGEPPAPCRSSSAAACATARPPICSERAPPVPPPRRDERGVGLLVADPVHRRCRAGRRRSSRTPSRGPGRGRRCRSGRSRSRRRAPPRSRCSLPPNPVISTYDAMPMPSWRGSPASRRRACSARAPSTSASRSASVSGRS